MNFQEMISKKPWLKTSMFFSYFEELEGINRRIDKARHGLVDHCLTKTVKVPSNRETIQYNEIDKILRKIKKDLRTPIIVPDDYRVYQEIVSSNAYHNFINQVRR